MAGTQITVGSTTTIKADFQDGLGTEVVYEGDGSYPIRWMASNTTVRILPDSSDPSTVQVMGVSSGRAIIHASCGPVVAQTEVDVIMKGEPVKGTLTAAASAAAPASTAAASTTSAAAASTTSTATSAPAASSTTTTAAPASTTSTTSTTH
jgi:hypothetical protein